MGGLGVPVFRWLCPGAIPATYDLRECGWDMACASAPEDVCLAHCSAQGPAEWARLLDSVGVPQRPGVLLLGVAEGRARAWLLRAGFGEVLGEAPDLEELDARAQRLARRADTLPRQRTLGGLSLDLFARDGLVAGRPLGLHPREFALIWRLAETPGLPVSKGSLIRDVWRLGHVPETNSLAVHVFRLRRKLELAGIRDLVRTEGEGYRLAWPPGAVGPGVPLAAEQTPHEHGLLQQAVAPQAAPGGHRAER